MGKVSGADIIFQFHKGTIKTAANVNGVAAPSAFQFHKGTIKTCY